MVSYLRLAKALWGVTAAFAFLAALAGVLFKGLYVGLFLEEYLPGALPQDILTMVVSGTLIFLAATTKNGDVKKQVVALGLLGSLFYLYGIFTIERVYNSFYLLYAAIFALSFWSIAISLAGFTPQRLATLRFSPTMVKITAYASILIALLFTFLWTMALIPLMREHTRIEYLYSIYILDLCFVMPAFAITAIMSLRKMPLGILLGPAMMLLGFFVIFPLGLNELAKPSVGLPANPGAMAFSFAFSFFMLTIGVLHLSKVRLD
jgi:hypothetical protein